MSDEYDDISLYEYELPEALIAAYPAERRAASRLLIARREGQRIEHAGFEALVELLEPGTLLVFNDTRVVPARMAARKETGGRVELLIIDVVSPSGPGRWEEPASAAQELVLEAMTRTSKPLRPGQPLLLDEATAPELEVVSYEAGIARLRVVGDFCGSATELLASFGELPLPPYIVRKREASGEDATRAEDHERYQTVYAARPGSVAAPTAGLHFTPELLAGLDARGIERAHVTLRVGPGTFRPVTAEQLSAHVMHHEEYTISPALRDAVAAAKARGSKVVAVGTTTVRALEAEARRADPFAPGTRSTDLFLRPGNELRLVDGLVTNFHLPRSTLLALVSALAGVDFMRRIYAEAVDRQYRFYSYGDAMVIL